MTRATEAFLRLSTLSPFDANRFAEESFKLDSKLVFVGVVSNQNLVLTSRSRENHKPTFPEPQGDTYLSIIPPMILDSVEKLQPILGKTHILVVRYDKLLISFFRLRDMIVVWMFEREVETPFMTDITDALRKLSKQYLYP